MPTMVQLHYSAWLESQGPGKVLRYLFDMTKLIKISHRSNRFHLLVMMGAPVWAKTYTTRRALGELGVDYWMLGSYSTPLALYNHLPPPSDGRI